MLWFSLFQCWWWWRECEILLVKDFTTSPQISLFWELKLDLDQGWGWDFGSLWNGWYMLYFMTFEPMNWARLEICYWRFSLFWNKSDTCCDDHISDQSFFIAGDWSPEKTVLSRELSRAIDEEFGTSVLQYTIKHFDMLFSTRCFWVEDFDVLSVDIWLECEPHCQVKRILHVDNCWWIFPGHHCNWQSELWELYMVYPDEAFFWF